MRSVVTYLRVSTGRQGKSGLGLEAQREAIARFVEAEGLTVLAEHVEVETGRGRTPSIAAQYCERRWLRRVRRKPRSSLPSSTG